MTMTVTTVYNLDTEEETVFTLPPDQAVVAAFEQRRLRRNFETWDYPSPSDHSDYKRTKHGHVCGNFWAKA